jgi:hypothetical protein
MAKKRAKRRRSSSYSWSATSLSLTTISHFADWTGANAFKLAVTIVSALVGIGILLGADLVSRLFERFSISVFFGEFVQKVTQVAVDPSLLELFAKLIPVLVGLLASVIGYYLGSRRAKGNP